MQVSISTLVGSGNVLCELASILTKYFVESLTSLDSSEKSQLTVSEFDNVAASLLLIEVMLSASSNRMLKEIQNVISMTPRVAKASSLLMEHLYDDGIDIS